MQQKFFAFDPSMWSLLASNLVSIYLAVTQGWSLIVMMWIYWFQSIAIGLFNYKRIMALKNFSTLGVFVNGKNIDANEETKKFLAKFFLENYGLFNSIHAFFLIFFGAAGLFGKIGPADVIPILSTSIIFFANHWFSFNYNKVSLENENIGRLISFTSARIFPMQLTLILGGMIGSGIIWLFLFLKTFVDMAMHAMEHDAFLEMTLKTGSTTISIRDPRKLY